MTITNESEKRVSVWVLVFGGYPSTRIKTIEVAGASLVDAIVKADAVARAERSWGYAAGIERIAPRE